MPISYIGSSTGVTSATLPSHQAGDLIVAFAYRDDSTTVPTQPSGVNWTSIATANNGNTNSSRLGYKIAVSSSETTGTWSNATSVIFAVYRGVNQTTPIGGNTGTNGSSTNISFPTVTLTQNRGDSWVLGFAGHRSTNVAIDTAPSNMINRNSVSDATDEAAIHDTDGGVTSWSATVAAVGGTSSGWSARTLEILNEPLIGEVDLSSSGSILSDATVISPIGDLNGFRITEDGQSRITEASVFRITEQFAEAFAALNAVATLTPQANVIARRNASLSATGVISPTAIIKQLGVVTLSSTGALTSIGVRKTPGVVSISGQGSLTSVGRIIKYGFSVLPSTATISSVGSRTTRGEASLATTGSSLYAGVGIFRGRSELNAVSTQTTNSKLTTFGTSSLQGNSSTNVDSQLTTYGEVTLNGTGTISANGKYIVSSSFSSTSSLGADVSLIIYGQVGSTIVVIDRETEEEDLRLTEDDNQRITEDTLSNLITSGAIFNSTLIPFSSKAYVNVNGIWKEFTPFVKYEGTWVAPEKTYRRQNGMWKRIY